MDYLESFIEETRLCSGCGFPLDPNEYEDLCLDCRDTRTAMEVYEAGG